MSAQSHQSDPRVLNRRTLEHDHRRLAAILSPGDRVLDVGCGTGAITAGIAARVGAAGSVIGVDRDDSLLAIAREHIQPNLAFEHADACSLPYGHRFDIVTAARTLQWVSDPLAALISMRRSAKPGGRIVDLDFNHANNAWEPGPPGEFARFYSAFLRWRSGNGWDNLMAANLPALSAAAGIAGVETHLDDEIALRGGADFEGAAAIWLHVVNTLGHQIVTAGLLSESEREAAAARYEIFVRDELVTQRLEMRTIVAFA